MRDRSRDEKRRLCFEGVQDGLMILKKGSTSVIGSKVKRSFAALVSVSRHNRRKCKFDNV